MLGEPDEGPASGALAAALPYAGRLARRTGELVEAGDLRTVQAIGVRLRQMFDEVVNEEVPDEFLEILRRADERGAGKL